MQIKNLKEKLPTMVIWMAKEAVMEGVKAYNKSQKERDIQNAKKEAGDSYNYTLAHAYNDGMNVAAEVLWKLFHSMSIECQRALEEVAKVRDGYCGNHESYLDDFIIALEKVQRAPVRIREEE